MSTPQTPPYHATTPQAPVPASPLLLAKLAELRARHLSVEAGKGIAWCILICVELLAIQMVADWWFDFSRGTRAVLFLIQFAVFNGILFRFLVLPRLRPPDDDDLALRVERAHPELASRLISSIQLARPGALSSGAATAFALSTIEQTEAITRPMDFRSLVDLRLLKRLAMAGGLVLVLGLSALYASRSAGLDLLKRAFLADVAVPRKTRFTLVTGDLTLGRGDTLRLEATVEGLRPARGTVVVGGEGKRDTAFEMQPASADRSRYARSFENVQEDLSYHFQVNDAISPVYRIRVVPRPAANPPECEQLPPAYTGLKPMKRSPGDLTLLAGSRLRLKAQASQDLKSATLRLLGTDERRPLTLDPARPREIQSELFIPAKGLTGFAFELVDAAGMKSAEGTVYRVDIVPDKPPQPKITLPERKEELLTRLATLVIGFEVADDFAVRKVQLKYRVSSLDGGAEKSLELNLAAQSNRVRHRHEWKMTSFQPPLSEGSLIEYWIEAEDNNDVTGPGIGRSEHQIARIVSENDKRADLLNRAGDSMGVLGDVAADQEKLNRNLGTLILEKTGAK